MELQNMATDIKNLGQNMVSSFSDRKKTIETLQDDVHELLRDSQKLQAEKQVELKEMFNGFQKNLHKELRQLLKNYTPAQRKARNDDLMATFHEDIKSIRKENAQARRDLHKLMDGFRKEHRQRQEAIGEMAGSVKEMFSNMSKARGITKKAAIKGERKLSKRAK